VAQRPEYLTVPEVMARLRLGRTTVYEQARLYLATGGAEGIPCRRFGRSLRFPAAAFDTPGADSSADRRAEVVDLTDVRRRHASTVDRKLPAHDVHLVAPAAPPAPTSLRSRSRTDPTVVPVLTPPATNPTKDRDALAPAVLCRPVRRSRVEAVGRC
jgi:hypothetical protein